MQALPAVAAPASPFLTPCSHRRSQEVTGFLKSDAALASTLREYIATAEKEIKGNKVGLLFDVVNKRSTDPKAVVSRQEFISTLHKPHWPLVKMFHSIDADKSGKISKAELDAYLKKTKADGKEKNANKKEDFRKLLKEACPKHGNVSAAKQLLFDILEPAEIEKAGGKAPANAEKNPAEIKLDEFLDALCVEHWDLVEFFRAIDADNNGQLDSTELKSFMVANKETPLGKRMVSLMKKCMQKTIVYGKPEQLFEALDSDKNETISMEEFVAGMFNPKLHMVTLFRQIDTNNSGTIEQEELESFLKTDSAQVKDMKQLLKLANGAKGTNDIFGDMDTNKDNKITKHEFCSTLALRKGVKWQVAKTITLKPSGNTGKSIDPIIPAVLTLVTLGGTVAYGEFQEDQAILALKDDPAKAALLSAGVAAGWAVLSVLGSTLDLGGSAAADPAATDTPAAAVEAPAAEQAADATLEKAAAAKPAGELATPLARPSFEKGSDQEKLQTLYDIFALIDKDQDASVSASEMMDWLYSKHDKVLQLQELVKYATGKKVDKGTLFEVFAKKSAKAITRQEFISTLYEPHWPLVKMFQTIDKNNNGTINKAELAAYLAETKFGTGAEKVSFQ